MVTYQRLRDVLSFDPSSGCFYWILARGRVLSGDAAGSVGRDGRLRIWIDGKSYLAHRLAWLYTYGAFPLQRIDHINRDFSDNRPSNLRLASPSENAHNSVRRRTNKSGIIGVSFKKKNRKWVAQICVCGKKIHLGLFDTIEEAKEARIAAEEKYHPFKISGNARVAEESNEKNTRLPQGIR